jgi:hypothetical protein
MPVLISRYDNSDPQKGVINIKDVHKLLSDYQKKVKLECIDSSRNPVHKRFYFQINIKRLEKILKHSQNKSILRINMCLNLPGQLDCAETELIENNLSILVCGLDAKGKPLLKDGSLVLAEGFLDHPKFDLAEKGKKLDDDECCVQGIPMLDV